MFAFRYRARRALYECLSAHYVNMAAGQGGTEVKGALPTTLVIENPLPGAGQNRGAALANGPRVQAQPRPVVASQGSGAFEQSEVWRIVQTQVAGECNQAMRQVADDARDQKLTPVPARWDGGASSQPGTGYVPAPAPQYQQTNTNVQQ
jgi:hypothetical protein